MIPSIVMHDAYGPALLQMEKRIRRAREKFDAQLADVEASERAMLAKYNECKQRLATTLEELAALKGRQTQREASLEDLQQVSGWLTWDGGVGVCV